MLSIAFKSLFIHRGEMAMVVRAQELIRTLRLKPHPEGGYYREIYRSKTKIKSSQGLRSSLTQIYFLLPRGEISRWHRVLSDEAWIFIEGAPLHLYRLDSNLKNLKKIQLGSLQNQATPTAMICRNEWQAAESSGSYTLLSCLVAPGFEFKDFCFLDENLISKKPIFSKNRFVRRFI